MAPGAFVEALVDGIFNDPDHRAQKVSAGDYLTVADGWYVESLVKDGLVKIANTSNTGQVAVTHDWHEGQNMEGIGPHLTDRLAELNPPKLGAEIVGLVNELRDLDAALALVGDGVGPNVDSVASSVIPPGRIPESKVKIPESHKLVPERSGRRRG